MATYDYKCPDCEYIFEEKHSMLLEPEIKCPKCETLCKKHITVANIDKRWDGATWEDTKFRK